MKIAVLDYSAGTVDIISVPHDVIATYGGVEDYLMECCDYNLDEISWMEMRQAKVLYLDSSDIKRDETENNN